MIHTNRFAAVTPAERRPPAGESVLCPWNREHSVRMDWETRDGIRTGRMVAWCYTCSRSIPRDPNVRPPRGHCSPKKLAALAESRKRRQHAHIRERNDCIRAAFAAGATQKELAAEHGLTVQSISNIVRVWRHSA